MSVFCLRVNYAYNLAMPIIKVLYLWNFKLYICEEEQESFDTGVCERILVTFPSVCSVFIFFVGYFRSAPRIVYVMYRGLICLKVYVY